MDWTVSIAIKILTFFLTSIRISGKSIKSDDKKINKSSFYTNKKLFSLNDIDVNKKLVSKKETYGTKGSLKNFIGYNDGDVIRSLCILILCFPRILHMMKKIFLKLHLYYLN